MSTGLKKDLTTGVKSNRASSVRALARDLKQQFEEYVLREDDESEEVDINEAEPSHKNKENQPAEFNKFKYERTGNKSKQRSSAQRFRMGTSQPAEVALPRSYILAMEHLQDSLTDKEAQITQLKQQLLGQQQTILESESRINQILGKYQALLDICAAKQSEIAILSREVHQLRLDKENAIKQAARALESGFKADELSGSGFRGRAMSIQGPHEPRNSTLYMLRDPETQDIRQSIVEQSRRSQIQKSPSTLLGYSNAKPPLQGYRQRQRDFISYQKQILRGEKQLITLNYRMECLERKLAQNPREDGLKDKIRKLSQDIEIKQRSVNDLKKL